MRLICGCVIIVWGLILMGLWIPAFYLAIERSKEAIDKQIFSFSYVN